MEKERDIYLTHALEFFFELGHVLAVGDAEIIVRIGTLIHAVGRSGGANSHDSGRAFCTLRLTNLFNTHHPS